MAIYVYTTATGALYSYIPSSLTIAQAQAGGQLSSNAVLTANGFTAVDGLAPLDSTHVWDVPTHTVVTVTAPKSIPTLLQFLQRFTGTEREAIEGLIFTGTQAQKNAVSAFWRYVQSAGGVVDCNDSYVQTKVNQLETIGTIAAGRAAQILV